MPDPQKKKRIVCIGGGMGLGFRDNPAFSDWLLDLIDKPKPRILYIPTATGESSANITSFENKAFSLPCHVSVLSLFEREESDEELKELILSQDMIYVAGGNTANMLAIWDVHGLRPLLKEAYEQGIVLAGKSAGALCWFEGGMTDSFGPKLRPITNTLGLLSGSYVPHYNGKDISRHRAYHENVANGALPAGIGAPDGMTILYEDGKRTEIIADHGDLTAELVEARGNEAHAEIVHPTEIMYRKEFIEHEPLDEFRPLLLSTYGGSYRYRFHDTLDQEPKTEEVEQTVPEWWGSKKRF